MQRLSHRLPLDGALQGRQEKKYLSGTDTGAGALTAARVRTELGLVSGPTSITGSSVKEEDRVATQRSCCCRALKSPRALLLPKHKVMKVRLP
jgi:hypothetical protein